MTQQEISSTLDWFIRHHKGFYCNGKKYTGITYHKDGTVDLNNYDEDYYILNATVVRIESFIITGDRCRAKNVIIEGGEELC